MTKFAAILGIGSALIAISALSASGGRLGTLERGAWACELPGDAEVSRGVPVPEAGFEITNSSTYSADGGRGNYLRTGDRVTMTTGPRKGDRYSVESERFLRKLGETGEETGLRCIKLGAAGIVAPGPNGQCKPAKRKGVEQAAGDEGTRLAAACDGAEEAGS
jgi:hypothetical protein